MTWTLGLVAGKWTATGSDGGFREFPSRVAAMEYIESCVTRYGDTFNEG